MISKNIKITIYILTALYFLANLVHAQSLVFNNLVQDAVLPAGERYVKFTYHFTNKGTDVVKINKIELSCGCSSYQLDKDYYAAGESGLITVTVDTKDKVEKAHAGIAIETNEKNSVYILEGNIKIPNYIFVSPRMLRWKVDGAMREQYFQVIFNPADENSIKYFLGNITTINGHFDTRVMPTEDKNRFHVYVTPRKNVKCGDIITVPLNPKNPSQNSQVIAFIGENIDLF